MRLIDADALINHIVEKYGRTEIIFDIDEAPIIEAELVVKCKDCKWFDKKEDSSYGYCHAMKHGHYSKHWEISIYRKYNEDFYCADGEKMYEEEDR